jgi:pyruvoyl-dependent arginine decarboxylase (PvlArgDC)
LHLFGKVPTVVLDADFWTLSRVRRACSSRRSGVSVTSHTSPVLGHRIEQQNLVYVSSILPPRCEVIAREVGIELLKPGDITFCVLARFRDQ